MKEQDVIINYRSKSLLLGQFAKTFYSALFCFAILAFLGTLGMVKSPHLGIYGFWEAIFLLLLVISFQTARLFSKSCITINPDTIEVPARFFLSMQGRLQRLWSDISHIAVTTGNSSGKDQLLLYFKSGGRAAISLRSMERSRLEEFLLCVEMRAADARRDLGLAAMLDVLHYEKSNKGEISYTQLWELDMNRRFSPMAYVPLEPEQVIQGGQIKILSQLGFGGLSAVYLAKRNSKERVVVKESAIPSGTDPIMFSKAEEMLRKEANLLIELSHPQIVKVLDFFIEQSKAYLILEFVPGENLRQIVYRTGPIAQETVLDWVRQLCDILAYLHNRVPPVVHRDITPDNIIVDGQGKIVLIDFGAANEFVATATGTLVGKQAYMPPEQFKGKAVIASDIYSLGATMFFLLAGTDPEPLCELHPQLTNKAVSKEVDILIGDCTRLELEARVPTANEIIKRIAKLNDQDRRDIASTETVTNIQSTR